MKSEPPQLSPVLLPDEEWISHWEVTKAIGEAFHPDRRGASGMLLITGKCVSSGMPYRISEDELRALSEHAGKLPEVSLSMSDEDWSGFLCALESTDFPARYAWRPLKPTEPDLYAAHCEGTAMKEGHTQAFRERIASRTMRAMSSSRVEVHVLEADTRLFRADVEVYLTHLGIKYVVGSSPREAIAPTATRSAGSEPRWTPDLIAVLRASVADKSVKWAQREAQFGASRQRLQEVLKKDDERQRREARSMRHAGVIGAMADSLHRDRRS